MMSSYSPLSQVLIETSSPRPTSATADINSCYSGGLNQKLSPQFIKCIGDMANKNDKNLALAVPILADAAARLSIDMQVAHMHLSSMNETDKLELFFPKVHDWTTPHNTEHSREKRFVVPLPALALLAGSLIGDMGIRILTNVIHENRQSGIQRYAQKNRAYFKALKVGHQRLTRNVMRTNLRIDEAETKIHNIQTQVDINYIRMIIGDEFQATGSVISDDLDRFLTAIHLSELEKTTTTLLPYDDARKIQQSFQDKNIHVDVSLDSVRTFVTRHPPIHPW